MEGIMAAWLLLLPLSLLAETTSVDERVVGVFYLKPIFSHVHQSASNTSSSLTTIQCAHPVKVIESSKVSVGPEWAYVEVAEFKGFIQKEFLSEKKTECFQGKYPKFFDSLNLDLSELYYWGRLYDRYIQGETRLN
jgi:hypothetical protein